MNNIDSINSAGITVKGQHVSWRELTLAATQDDTALATAYSALLDRAISQYGAMGLGGADYHERTRVLAEVHRLRASREAATRAEKQAAAEARAQREDAARGYHVHVVSDTSGATWRAELRCDGAPTRKHVGAGEGCSYGHYAPAEAEAREIADRLRARGITAKVHA
jgi:hypothetical protein